MKGGLNLTPQSRLIKAEVIVVQKLPYYKVSSLIKPETGKMGKAFILCFLSICVFYCTIPASLSNITPVRYESEKTWERMLTGLRVQTNETEETTDTPKLINVILDKIKYKHYLKLNQIPNSFLL